MCGVRAFDQKDKMVYLDFLGNDIFDGVKNPTKHRLDELIKKFGVRVVFETANHHENHSPVCNLTESGGCYFTDKYAYMICGRGGYMVVVVSRTNKGDLHVLREGEDYRLVYGGSTGADASEYGYIRSVMKAVDDFPVMNIQEGLTEFCQNIAQGNVDAAIKSVNSKIGWSFWGVLLLIIIMGAWFTTQTNGLYSVASAHHEIMAKNAELMAKMNTELAAAKKEVKDTKERQLVQEERQFVQEEKVQFLEREHAETNAIVQIHTAGLQAARNMLSDFDNLTQKIGTNLKELTTSHMGLQAEMSAFKLAVADQFAAIVAKLGRIPGVLNGIEGPQGGVATVGAWDSVWNHVKTLFTYGISILFAFTFLSFCMAAYKLMLVRRANANKKTAKRA